MKKIYQFDLNKEGIFVSITRITNDGWDYSDSTCFKIFCIDNSVYLKRNDTENLLIGDRLTLMSSEDEERNSRHFADIVLEHNLNNVNSIVCFLATLFFKNTKIDSLKCIYRYLTINGN